MFIQKTKLYTSCNDREEDMHSIAIWVERKQDMPSDTQDNIIEDIHINIWYDKKDTYINYIEFGFMLQNIEHIDSIMVYLPFKVDKEKFIDILFEGLKDQKEELLNALFNTPLRIVENNVVIANDFRYDRFGLARTDLDIMGMGESADGSLLRIMLQTDLHNKKIPLSYIRFRINKLENILNTFNENFWILEGLFRKEGIFELNINSTRKLPQLIVKKMKNKSMGFKRIHTFLMLDNTVDLYFMNIDLKDARVLENSIWENYIKVGGAKRKTMHQLEKIVAYHWYDKVQDESDSLKSLNLFAKIRYIKSNFVLLGMVMVFLLVIGIISSIMANYINAWVAMNLYPILTAVLIVILIVVFLTVCRNICQEKNLRSREGQ